MGGSVAYGTWTCIAFGIALVEQGVDEVLGAHLIFFAPWTYRLKL